MHKFKIGDKVVSDGTWLGYKGQVCTVDEVREPGGKYVGLAEFREKYPRNSCGVDRLTLYVAPPKMILAEDAKARKAMPITTGVLDYFPRALAAVAACSKAGNDQHNPGQPLHWDRSKSTDHVDCIARHLIDRDTLDTDGIAHAAKLAWRALAFLETKLEAEARA